MFTFYLPLKTQKWPNGSPLLQSDQFNQHRWMYMNFVSTTDHQRIHCKHQLSFSFLMVFSTVLSNQFTRHHIFRISKIFLLTNVKRVFFFTWNSPGIQTHLNVPGSSRQDPSLWQGWDSHSLTFVSHLGPVNPWVQLQAKLPGVFTQMPSCSHGDPVEKRSQLCSVLRPLLHALNSYSKTMDEKCWSKFAVRWKCGQFARWLSHRKKLGVSYAERKSLSVIHQFIYIPWYV